MVADGGAVDNDCRGSLKVEGGGLWREKWVMNMGCG